MREQLLYYLAQQPITAPRTNQSIGVQPSAKSAPEAKSAPTGGSLWPTAFMFLAVFVGMYFLVIRPQRKEEKRKKELLGSLKKGDAVVTSSGILGTIASVKEGTVVINVGDNTRMEFLRSAVSDVRNKTEQPAVAKTKKK